MPQYDGVHGESHAPGDIVAQGRQGEPDKILKQQFVVKEHVAEFQFDIPAECRYDNTAQKLKDARQGGGDGHAGGAQLRRAEKPENKHGVQEDIQGKGHHIQNHTDGHSSDAPKNRQIDFYNAPAQIGHRHHAQISGADGDQLRVVGKKLHHQLRRKKGKCGKATGNNQRKPHGDTLNGADRLQLSLTPILRAQHGGPGSQTVINHKEDIGVVGGQRYGGDGGLSHVV